MVEQTDIQRKIDLAQRVRSRLLSVDSPDRKEQSDRLAAALEALLERRLFE